MVNVLLEHIDILNIFKQTFPIASFPGIMLRYLLWSKLCQHNQRAGCLAIDYWYDISYVHYQFSYLFTYVHAHCINLAKLCFIFSVLFIT